MYKAHICHLIKIPLTRNQSLINYKEFMAVIFSISLSRTLDVRTQNCRGIAKVKWKTSDRAAILTKIGTWVPGRLSEGHKNKILASRICSLCALDSRLLPDGSRGWIRLRVVHRRLSEDAYRLSLAPPRLSTTLSPTYFALYRYLLVSSSSLLFFSNSPDNDVIVDGNTIWCQANE